MPRRPRFPCDPRCRVGVVAALALGLAAAAHAQLCTGPLPKPGRPAAAASGPAAEKFALIASQCPGLGAPRPVRPAAQLELYDGAASRPIPFGSTPAASAALPAPDAPAPVAPAAPPAPLERGGSRVVQLAPALAEAAREHGIDPLLLHAIAHVESRHNPAAVSPAGARGLMQVMPATAARFGVAAPERSLHDVQTNLRASASLLRTLLQRYDSDLSLVLAAYNAGEGAVARAGGRVPNYPETQAYVRDVLAIHRRLRDTFTVDRHGALVARGSAS